jgi:hypothetical protein
MQTREKFENALYSVRFVGDDLTRRGVSIYDLSNSLLAFQRIVHKAHLSLEERLVKGAFPDIEDRQRLALQIGERRRQSDAFALVPILSDPQVQQYMLKLADYVFSGIVGYYVGDVLRRVQKEKDPNKQIFIGSIYTEVANIVNRIDASGGVEGINIGAPSHGRETIASFDSDTKSYLSSIRGEVVLGDYQEIIGKVYKLYPASRIVAIRRAGGKTVSVFLNEQDFDRIRYHRESNPQFIFRGRPKFQFGIETRSVSDFVADEIEYFNDEA